MNFFNLTYLESNIDETSASNIGSTDVESGDNPNKPQMTQTHSQSHSHSTKYTSDDESSSMTSGSGHLGAHLIASVGGSSSPLRKALGNTSGHIPAPDPAVTPTAIADLEQIVIELKERREECHRLSEELEALKTQLQNECSVFHQSLQEERYRFEVSHSLLTLFL